MNIINRAVCCDFFLSNFVALSSQPKIQKDWWSNNIYSLRKQLSRCVLIKRCSENIQQIEITRQHVCSPVNSPYTFRTHFVRTPLVDFPIYLPIHYITSKRNIWKHYCGGILWKRVLNNMLEIYRITPMVQYDFNKLALQIYWNRTSAYLFYSKFAVYLSEHLFIRTCLEGSFCTSVGLKV